MQPSIDGCKKLKILFSQLLIQLKEFGNTFGFSCLSGSKAVGLHDGTVVVLMSTAEFGRHSHFIIEIGKRTIRVFGTGIQNSLCRGFNLGFLFFGRCRKYEIIVNDIIRIAVG